MNYSFIPFGGLIWIFLYVLAARQAALNLKPSAKGYERIIQEILRRSDYFSTSYLFFQFDFYLINKDILLGWNITWYKLSPSQFLWSQKWYTQYTDQNWTKSNRSIEKTFSTNQNWFKFNRNIYLTSYR